MEQNNIALWQNLEATLQHDLPVTSELLTLLERERKALENRDYTEFEKILNPKKQLLLQLEQHATLRQQLLQQAGFTDESTTIIELREQAPTVADAWQELATLWRSCQQLNEVNERIAKRTRMVVGQILDTIRGQNNQTRLYTSKGDAQTSASTRSITSA
jgi:flagella synthesis protein FlgN